MALGMAKAGETVMAIAMSAVRATLSCMIAEEEVWRGVGADR